MNITKSISIDMGHRLPNHNSKCRNFHGHRYTFDVTVSGEIETASGQADQGMVVDFSDLKRVMVNQIDHKYDHGFMICTSDPYVSFFRDAHADGMKVIEVPFIPTAENFGIQVFKDLAFELWVFGIKLINVRVYETPTSFVDVTEKDKITYESK